MSIYTDLTDPNAVERALAEFDALGRDEFLSRYRFGEALGYMVVANGSRYDSKAVFGVAMRNQHGILPRSTEFSGGKRGAAKRLEELDFTVEGPAPRGRRCPRCRSARAERIVYGMPAFDHDPVDGPVFYAGCSVPLPTPRWNCNSCGHQWGGDVLDVRYTVHVRFDEGEYVAFVTGGLPDNYTVGTSADNIQLLVAHVREALEAALGDEEEEYQVDYVVSEATLLGAIRREPPQ